jgi:RHS repeat-associated protein
LVLTDQINTANSQTCKYGDPSASVPGYDDLGRIISANCASAWSQTFAFDPFGNLKKTGSAQFLPTYTGESGAGSPINRYFSIPGGSVSYDGNGNLTNDVTHSYTWDADGNMLSTDGTTVTMMYDAMDRMIEQTRGSSHTEIAYGPYGMKLALMNGQTLVNAFVKLPGGSRAVYDSSGLAYYRHSDHLGSSRLATTPSRTKYYDVAYAPYGEDYNGSGTTPDLAFTDQNQDTVKNSWSSNLYDFMFREYRTAHGRWTSPDPAGLGVVDPTNPQTWNRYADVLNKVHRQERLLTLLP